jgi:ABC-2 type transport system permease protein
MVQVIAKREIKNILRDKIFLLVATVLFGLLLTALFTSLVSVKKLNKERSEAQQMSREGWLTQPPKNPHSAAHYGNFAFRIKSPLSLFDNGLDTYTGTYLFLEPHKQNGDKFSQAEESTSLLRFGELTPAMVLQSLLPLLVLFVCFGSISKEKENNTIKMLLTQGTSMRQVIIGKVIGNLIVFAALLASFFIFSIAALSLLKEHALDWGRLSLLFVTYLLYTGIWVSISVVVSAWSNTSRSSLLKLLAVWMLAIIIVPKVSANIGNIKYKTPSQFQFAQLINKDINEGIDGHNPYDERRDALLAATLKQYKVAKEEDLPVNFDAIAMIESEKYTTDVFRKRKTEIENIFKKQNQISELASFINPTQAMQYSSMALCGTDYNHYTDFQNQAEEYRLYFVNVMNEYMSTHTKSGDWDTKFGKETYQLTQPFTFRPASLSFAIKNQPLPFVALICWIIICAMLIVLTNRIKLI